MPPGSTQANFILELPDAVKSVVVSKLDSRALSALSQSCRNFRNLVFTYCKGIKYTYSTNFLEWPRLLTAVARHPGPLNLTVRDADGRHMMIKLAMDIDFQFHAVRHMKVGAQLVC